MAVKEKIDLKNSFFFGLVKGLTWFENLYCTGIVYVCRWQELVDSILLLKINTD